MSQIDLSLRAYAAAFPDLDSEIDGLSGRIPGRVSAGNEPTPRLARHGRELPVVRLRRPTPPERGAKTAVAEPSYRRPTDAEIEARAHEIFLARNGEVGNPVVDWLEAEQQLITEFALGL